MGVLDVRKGRWRELPVMKDARAYVRGVAVGGQVCYMLVVQVVRPDVYNIATVHTRSARWQGSEA